MHMRAVLFLPALALTLALGACNPDPVINPHPDPVDADGDTYDSSVDCNDNDASIHPGADESCDEIDNDCDGLVDEYGAIDAPVWFVDGDGDGYGDPEVTREACEAPEDYVDNDEDCDDSQDAVYPGADEVCDDLDNDCDGEVDGPGSLDARLFYWDFDADGYGDPDRAERSCRLKDWLVENDLDCDDAKDAVHPEAQEICDGIDNDCDTLVDDADSSTDPATFAIWYLDGDGDGYGNPDEDQALLSCAISDGYADNPDDCDDSNDAVTTGCAR